MSKMDFNVDDQDDDESPYGSVSNRDPLVDLTPALSGEEDASSDASASSSPSSDIARNAIRDMILKRAGSSDSSSDSSPSLGEGADSLSNDPLMKDLAASQKKVDEERRIKKGSDYILNMGQALSQLSQGVNAPRPNTQLYASMEKQNADDLKDRGEDVDRRAKVMGAIEQRKSREGIASDNRDARALMSKTHSDDLASRMQDKLDSKKEAQINKWTTQMKDDLDPNKARAGNLALNQKRVDNAQRIEALLSQVHNNPDPRQMEELAISSQALLSSSGSPAAEQVKALIPHTAMGSVNAFKEWLTNDPTGTGQQEFVKRMAETVQREKDVAAGQVQQAQKARLSAYQKFKAADPETYNGILNSYGLGEPDKKQGMSVSDEMKIPSVKMQAPDGTIRLIPAEKVDAAIAAGGKRL